MSGTAGVAALDRALSILACFSPHDRGLTLAELAQRTGLYKSTILRLAVSLENAGYLVRRMDGKYMLGSSLFRLGQIYQRSFDLAEFVAPGLRKLSASTNFSASFWIREEQYRVCLYRTEFSTGRRDLSGNVGERCPLDEGGSASIIFRAFDGARGARFEQARRTGVAVSLGEFIPELAAISSPVFGAGGAVLGVLSLGGFRSCFTKPVIAGLTVQVIAAARDLGIAPVSTSPGVTEPETVPAGHLRMSRR